jgi:hypothetical protein
MSKSTGETKTANAKRYMTQLCKHWSHKYEVSFDETDARIALPAGPLTMHVEPDRLELALEVDDAVLARMQGVVEEHVRRFAFREQLEFSWSPVA